MKFFIQILVCLTITLGSGVLVASAQGYVPLAPLPIGPNNSILQTYEMGAYLAGMMKFIVAIAGVFAIIMLIIGGMKYVAASINPVAKSDANEQMTNALIGLALVLTSYLILNSINPKLVTFRLLLPPLDLPRVPTPVEPGVTPVGLAWPSDISERAELTSHSSSRITVNRSPGCTIIGQRPCTSIAGLGARAMNGLKSLASSCTDCRIRISGGTEYWMHGNRSIDRASNTTPHGQGGNVVDLSIGFNVALDAYIRGPLLTNGFYTNAISETVCAPGIRYRKDGAVYVDERLGNNPPHWHVCY